MECLYGLVDRSTIYELWCPALYFSSILSKWVWDKVETKYKALVELDKGKSNKEMENKAKAKFLCSICQEEYNFTKNLYATQSNI